MITRVIIEKAFLLMINANRIVLPVKASNRDLFAHDPAVYAYINADM